MTKFEVLRRAFSEFENSKSTWLWNKECGNEDEIARSEDDMSFWKAIIEKFLEK